MDPTLHDEGIERYDMGELSTLSAAL